MIKRGVRVVHKQFGGGRVVDFFDERFAWVIFDSCYWLSAAKKISVDELEGANDSTQ